MNSLPAYMFACLARFRWQRPRRLSFNASYNGPYATPHGTEPLRDNGAGPLRRLMRATAFKKLWEFLFNVSGLKRGLR